MSHTNSPWAAPLAFSKVELPEVIECRPCGSATAEYIDTFVVVTRAMGVALGNAWLVSSAVRHQGAPLQMTVTDRQLKPVHFMLPDDCK